MSEYLFVVLATADESASGPWLQDDVVPPDTHDVVVGHSRAEAQRHFRLNRSKVVLVVVDVRLRQALELVQNLRRSYHYTGDILAVDAGENGVAELMEAGANESCTRGEASHAIRRLLATSASEK